MQKRDSLYALLIGIDAYEAPGIRNLRTAAHDALSVERLLRARGGWTDVHCRIMTSPATAGTVEPTKGRILAELDRFSLAPMTPDDTFLFYFAGHGIEQAGEQFLLAFDSPLDRRLTKLRDCAVSLRSLREAMELIGAGQQLVILDACRNDPTEGTRSLGGDDDVGVVLTRDINLVDVGAADDSAAANEDVRRAWLSACDVGQKSFEHAASGNSWFFHNFAAVVDEAGESELSLSVVVRRISDRMRRTAWSELPQATEQRPVLIDDGAILLMPLALERRTVEAVQPAEVSTKPRSAPITQPPIDFERISNISIDASSLVDSSAQRADSELPPRPMEWLRLQSNLSAVLRTIEAVRADRHDQLAPACEAIKAHRQHLAEACRQVDRTRPALRAADLARLETLAGTEPAPGLTQIQAIAPTIPLVDLTRFVAARRAAAQADRKLSELLRQYEEAKERSLKTLEAKQAPLQVNMNQVQIQDLQEITRSLFGVGSAHSTFPLDLVMQWFPAIERRGYQWTRNELLDRIEAAFFNRASNGTSDRAKEREPAVAHVSAADPSLRQQLERACELSIDGADAATLCRSLLRPGALAVLTAGGDRKELDTLLNEVVGIIASLSRQAGKPTEGVRLAASQIAETLLPISRGHPKARDELRRLRYRMDCGAACAISVVDVETSRLPVRLAHFRVAPRVTDPASPCGILMVDQRHQLGRASMQQPFQVEWLDTLSEPVTSIAVRSNGVAALFGLSRGGLLLAPMLDANPKIVSIGSAPTRIQPRAFSLDESNTETLYATQQHTVVEFDLGESFFADGTAVPSWPRGGLERASHTSAVTYVASPSIGRLIASASRDGKVRVSTHRDDPPLGWSGQFTFAAEVNALAFDPPGERLLIVGNKRTIVCLDVRSGSVGFERAVPSRSITAAAFPSWGLDVFYTGSSDGTVTLWTADQPNPLWSERLHTDAVAGIGFSGGEWLNSGALDGSMARARLSVRREPPGSGTV